ncbi:DUF1566 domain-containing protein [Marichromatium gracile]|uniref:Lcl C-terminal domain-containing protein n=1 Tax=Marichromatium gracile TaxID=1048 RepID=A0ABR5VG77_MARGR|nr:DUF1566 domain-containing protein [Marichromatium gracile]KXX64748.1 hypothetical protein AY586_12495 [Marichromatium gracile]
MTHCTRLLPLVTTLALASPLQAQPPQPAEIPDAAGICLPNRAQTTPSADFTPIEDGQAVRHQPTGLDWQRCALGQRWDGRDCVGRPGSWSWRAAEALAAGRDDGWRLPRADELTTIVERCHPGPAVNPQVFPNTPGIIFWTSSGDTGGLDRAWAVSFFAGSRYRMSKEQEGAIRLVREAPDGAAAP